MREQIKVYDGTPLCLRFGTSPCTLYAIDYTVYSVLLHFSLLHDTDLVLLFNLVSVVEKLCIDGDSSSDIRDLGGIPLILTLLQYVPMCYSMLQYNVLQCVTECYRLYYVAVYVFVFVFVTLVT